MVIDDDPMALDLMRATLAGMGITCTAFERGRDALDAFLQLRPQAIILDLMMPELDGFAVLDALRSIPEARETPVYIWTSLTLSEAEYEQLTRSAQAILSKGGAGLVDMLQRLRRWRPSSEMPQREDA
jgi:CheY-like chemotaxis protein